jgi:uncharacterized membrane protein
MKAGMYIVTTLICLILYIAAIVVIAIYSEVLAILFVIQSFIIYLIHHIMTSQKKHI